MKQIATNALVMILATIYILLAVQAEPVTATLGWICAGLLVLAVVAQTIKQKG